MTTKLIKASKTLGGLNLKQEEFCKLYTSNDREVFGNGVQCYLEIYNKGRKFKISYKSAIVLASKELTKVNVLKRINELLETGGFTDENVDKQHLFLINQHADLKTKLGAIKEYNELKQRIQKKLDITSQGERIAFLPSEILNKHKINVSTSNSEHSGE